MSLRTIMIFPEFENMEVLESIREKYDPLAKIIRPHITIVFPFESRLANNTLLKILDKRLEGVMPFDIQLQGFCKCEDQFGNYLFLNLVKGVDTIYDIHYSLYHNEFKAYDMLLKYTPHITVGKLPTTLELNKAYEDIKHTDCKFCSTISKISVEMIGKHEESIIIMEKHLK